MRDISNDIQTAITQVQVRPIYLFEGQFISGYLRVWSGIGDFSWNSLTWIGAGSLLSISGINETRDVSANGVVVALSGIPSTLISLALSDGRQGYSGKIYLGFLDDADDLIDDPYLIFDGRLDVISIEEQGETSSITLNYESRLIDLQRSREIRYTDEEQKRLFPGDLGLEFVASLQEQTINWGRGGGKSAGVPTFNHNQDLTDAA